MLVIMEVLLGCLARGIAKIIFLCATCLAGMFLVSGWASGICMYQGCLHALVSYRVPSESDLNFAYVF